MKVACIGNMNNNHFTLARLLRDRGVDTDLLLLDEHDHFKPHADSYTLDHRNWTRQLDWPIRDMADPEFHRQIKDELAPYDFTIGCGYSPAYFHLAGRPLDIFMPYGADLSILPFGDKSPWTVERALRHTARWMLGRAPLRHTDGPVQFQRRGIEECRYVAACLTEAFATVLSTLNCHDKHVKLALPMVYSPVFNPQDIKAHYHQTHWHHEFTKLREQYEFLVFQQSRQAWKTEADVWSQKGNDVLLRGFAHFLERWSGNAGLLLMEYGGDVAASQALADELGIAERIHWFPKMLRKDLMVGIDVADVGAGQFCHGWMLPGSIQEFLAMGTPILHDRDESAGQHNYPDLYPMINAKQSGQVSDGLLAIANEPERYRKMGEDGRLWYNKHVVEGPIDTITALMEGREPRK